MALPRPASSLRLLDPPQEAIDEPITVDVPSNEIAPGVTVEDGAMHIEHGDGSTTIDFDPKTEDNSENKDFFRNLVGDIQEGEQGQIVSSLMEGIERDIESRHEWLETRALGVKLLGLKLEEPRGDVGTSSAPLEGMSTVRHPLLLEATIRFQATARGELLPAGGPVKVRNDTTTQSPSQSVAEKLSPGNGMVGAEPAPLPSGIPATVPTGYAEGGAVAAPAPTAPPPVPAAPAAAPFSQATASSSAPSNPAQQASPFATELAVPKMEEKDSLAAALEKDFNHYLTVTAPEYVPDTDRMLFYVGFGGDGFKKVYGCPLRRRPVSESVDANDLIVSNSSTDIRNCGRVTHRIKMRKSILKRMQILGVYADVELGTQAPLPKKDPAKEEVKEIEGVNDSMQKPEDLDYEIYESYCELESEALDKFAPKEFKGKGLPLPYRVTIATTSRKLLSITRNWNEDDEQALPKQFFVQFPFIRGLGFYGLGFVHVLGNTTSTLTAMWREMVDAGMFANFPGFLYSKGAGRQLSNQFRIPPGGGIALDVPHMTRIQDAVMPIPYKDPGAAFTAFAQWVESAGQRLGQTADVSIGEGKQDAPVGTTLALIEQATKVLDSVHKRLHWSQNEEFQLLKERFKEDPEAFWRHNKKPAMKWEKEQFLKALEDYNLVPVADPNNPTSLHRTAKAAVIEALASKYPQLINLQAALERIFRVAAIDSEGLFHPAPLPPPPDPRMLAIQQKSEQTTKTVEAQTSAQNAKTLAQALTAIEQLKDKAADRDQKERLEMLRISLDGMKNQDARAQRQQDMALDRVERMEERQEDRAWTQQEMDADRAKTMNKVRTEAVADRNRIQADAINKAREAKLNFNIARMEGAAKQREHEAEMRRKDDIHQQTLRHEEALLKVKVKEARALARTKKKSDSSK